MPTPTPTTAAATTASRSDAVQQTPRTAQEFQFAHRLLRKLVQDSTFFSVESAQRDYVWFPPRGINDTADLSSSSSSAAVRRSHDSASNNLPTASTITNSNKNNVSIRMGHPDENQQSHYSNRQKPPTQPKRQRRQRQRTVSTPLFLDYCLRSCTAANHTNNFNRRHVNNNYNSYNTTISQIKKEPSSILLRPASPLSFCSYNSKYSCSTVISTTENDDIDDIESEDHENNQNNVGVEEEDEEVVSKSSGCNSSVITAEEGEEAVHPMVMAELSDGCLNEDAASLNDVKSSAPSSLATAQGATTTNNDTTTSSSKPIVKKKHVVYCIHEKELEFGKILGSGGFGQVRLARIKNEEKSSSDAAGGESGAEDAAANNAATTDANNSKVGLNDTLIHCSHGVFISTTASIHAATCEVSLCIGV